MELINAVPVESHGIKLLEWSKGYELKWGKVNHHLASVLNPTLEELADHGAIAIYTMGIRNNRPIRGSKNTSTHSNGLIENGYKHWRDGSVGALGIDIRKVLFKDYVSLDHFETSLVVTDPGDLKNMIQWLEAREWKLYHKRINCVTPYHLHLQSAHLHGVL